MKITIPIIALAAVLAACASAKVDTIPRDEARAKLSSLGAFSISLTVKDLEASREFYAKLGFVPTSGDPAQHWQVLRNGDCVIGLFQGMFPKNMLTFNPGWAAKKTRSTWPVNCPTAPVTSAEEA